MTRTKKEKQRYQAFLPIPRKGNNTVEGNLDHNICHLNSASLLVDVRDASTVVVFRLALRVQNPGCSPWDGRQITCVSHFLCYVV